MTGFVVLCVVCGVVADAAAAGRLRHPAGGGRVRADGCLLAGRDRVRPGPAAPARARRGLARGGRQPHLGRPRRDVAARRAGRARGPRAGAAARRRSTSSRSTTRSPAGSGSASTGSRTGWPTRSATGWSRVCGSPARSAAASSAGCCATSRRTSATTRAPAPRWRPARRGPSTAPGSRSPSPWLVLLFMSFQSEVIHRYASPGRGVRARGRRGGLRGRLPADDADRPAAHRTTDPVVTPTVMGASSGRGPRRRAAAGRGPDPGDPSPAARRTRVLPYVRDLPQVGAPRRLRRRRRPLRRPASSDRCCARPPTPSSGCSAARRRYAAASSAPTSTRPCTSSGSSRWSGAWSGSRRPPRSACSGCSPTPARSASWLAFCAIAFVVGVLARDSHLTSQVRRREARILAEFPTVAELLALAVAAGESPVAALDRVVRRSGGELSARPRAGARRDPHRRAGQHRRSTGSRPRPGCRWSPGSPRASRSRSSAAPRSPTCCTPRRPTSARPAAAS